MFKPNEGTLDRIIRITLGLALLGLGYFIVVGPLQIVAYVAGVALVATGAVGYCGLYSLLGISTCPIKRAK